jgi:hypothetical protein
MRRLAEAHSRPGAVFYRYFRSAGGTSVISRAPRFRCADDGDWKMTRRWVDESLLVRELSLLLVTLPPSKFRTPSSPFQQHP